MITIHHLGVSQSERIVWLMEELSLPYQLKWYHRKPNRLAPDAFLALHPTAMAPVQPTSAGGGASAYKKAMAIAGPTAVAPKP